MLFAVLIRLGYRVQVAVSGQQALLALQAGRFAAVLMDCQMQVMDGYQSTGEIRRTEGSSRHTQSSRSPPRRWLRTASAAWLTGYMTTCPNRSTPAPSPKGCTARIGREIVLDRLRQGNRLHHRIELRTERVCG